MVPQTPRWANVDPWFHELQDGCISRAQTYKGHSRSSEAQTPHSKLNTCSLQILPTVYKHTAVEVSVRLCARVGVCGGESGGRGLGRAVRDWILEDTRPFCEHCSTPPLRDSYLRNLEDLPPKRVC